MESRTGLENIGISSDFPGGGELGAAAKGFSQGFFGVVPDVLKGITSVFGVAGKAAGVEDSGALSSITNMPKALRLRFYCKVPDPRVSRFDPSAGSSS